MTTALEGGEWSAARPGRTLPPGKTRYQFYRRLGGPQGRSGRTENLVPTGIRSRTVQPVVSHYTNWATRPTLFTCTTVKIKLRLLRVERTCGSKNVQETPVVLSRELKRTHETASGRSSSSRRPCNQRRVLDNVLKHFSSVRDGEFLEPLGEFSYQCSWTSWVGQANATSSLITRHDG